MTETVLKIYKIFSQKIDNYHFFFDFIQIWHDICCIYFILQIKKVLTNASKLRKFYRELEFVGICNADA